MPEQGKKAMQALVNQRLAVKTEVDCLFEEMTSTARSCGLELNGEKDTLHAIRRHLRELTDEVLRRIHRVEDVEEEDFDDEDEDD